LRNVIGKQRGVDQSVNDPLLSLTDVRRNFGEVEVLHGISLKLRVGEILGVSGMIGSGRTETMEGLCGLRRATATQVQINGVDVRINAPKQALGYGLCYLTEDRKGRGLLLGKSMRENLTLQALDTFGSILIDRAAEKAALATSTKEFDIRASHKDVKVGNMSGGNQQKLSVAKTMLSAPQIVIIDEPTRGIDIGTSNRFMNSSVASPTAENPLSSSRQRCKRCKRLAASPTASSSCGLVALRACCRDTTLPKNPS
jgi:ribose transport system ATP-binding protein